MPTISHYDSTVFWTIIFYAMMPHCKAILGRGQCGVMGWILVSIMPQVQNRLLDLLTCSPAAVLRLPLFPSMIISNSKNVACVLIAEFSPLALFRELFEATKNEDRSQNDTTVGISCEIEATIHKSIGFISLQKEQILIKLQCCKWQCLKCS